LFSNLAPRYLRRLADLMGEERYMEGARIVRDGDIGDTFYVILEGEAKVVSPTGRTVNRLRPGDYFGEISLLDGDVRTATVTSETPMTLMILERPRFMKLLKEEPEMTMHLLQGLARQVRRTSRSLVG
jgi:CRP-like cAMP-binding protein